MGAADEVWARLPKPLPRPNSFAAESTFSAGAPLPWRLGAVQPTMDREKKAR
jgi:hypothetical protein